MGRKPRVDRTPEERWQVTANRHFDIDSAVLTTNMNKRLLVVTIFMIVICPRAGTQD